MSPVDLHSTCVDRWQRLHATRLVPTAPDLTGCRQPFKKPASRDQSAFRQLPTSGSCELWQPNISRLIEGSGMTGSHPFACFGRVALSRRPAAAGYFSRPLEGGVPLPLGSRPCGHGRPSSRRRDKMRLHRLLQSTFDSSTRVPLDSRAPGRWMSFLTPPIAGTTLPCLHAEERRRRTGPVPRGVWAIRTPSDAHLTVRASFDHVPHAAPGMLSIPRCKAF